MLFCKGSVEFWVDAVGDIRGAPEAAVVVVFDDKVLRADVLFPKAKEALADPVADVVIEVDAGATADEFVEVEDRLDGGEVCDPSISVELLATTIVMVIISLVNGEAVCVSV